jgi:plastocyanin
LIPPIIRISPTGADPRQLIVAAGERVTFINNDMQPHDIAGGPDPATPDCPRDRCRGFPRAGTEPSDRAVASGPHV